MLEAQWRAGARPRSSLTVEETRAAVRAGREWQREPATPVTVRDAVANGVPVRLYGPESGQVVLFLHGGRFFSGDLESHDWPLRELAAGTGCRICAVNYRLAPECRHPAAVEDAICAGQWLRGQSDRLLTAGDSAGGYLAALAALALRPLRQVLIYPMLDPACDTESYREYWQGPWPSGEDMKRGWDLYGGEAVTAEMGDFPATAVVTAGVDPLRDEAWTFAAALGRRGVPVEHVHYSDMHHGFFTQTRLTRSQELQRVLHRIITA